MSNFTTLLISIEAVLLLIAGGAILLLSFWLRKEFAYKNVLLEYVGLMERGILIFDKKDRFFSINVPARGFLDFCAVYKFGQTSLKDFLNDLYDRAVDSDQSLSKTLELLSNFTRVGNFREIIQNSTDQLCLVEIEKVADGKTLIIVSDISALKENEDKFSVLQDHSYEMQQAIEASKNGVFVSNFTDGQHQIVFANDALCDILKVSKQDLENGNIFDLLSHIEDTDAQDKVNYALKNNLGCHLELHWKEGGDAFKWYDFNVTRVQSERRKSFLYTGILTDITQQKQMDAEMSHMQKIEALQKMAAGVAHDYNNILSIIDGHAYFAKKKADGHSDLSGHIESIEKASERGKILTNKILAYGRKGSVSKSSNDLNSFILRHQEDVEDVLGATASLELYLSDDPLYLPLSKDVLQQLLFNLVQNAKQAMQEGGVLKISTKFVMNEGLLDGVDVTNSESDYVLLKITDNGDGIKPEHLQKIFDPFFSTLPDGKGAGLGLSTVYGIVKDIGGDVIVKSRYGQGTTFEIYLPVLLVDVAKGPVIKANTPDDMSFEGYTVMVAEDEAEIRDMVCDMMGQLQFNVLSAQNGEEALVMQDDYDGHIDLLLTDIVMPKLNGMKLAELMLTERPETYVIFMSGYPKNEADYECILQKADFLAKPFKFENLSSVLFQNLTHKNLTYKEI